MLAELTALVGSQTPAGGGLSETAVSGLSVFRADRPSPLEPTMYEPVICLILQGAKELEVGSRRVRCPAGRSVVVRHTVPLRSQITEAAPGKPYLALILTLDPDVLIDLVDDDRPDDDLPGGSDASSLRVVDTDIETVDAMRRLYALNQRPSDVPVLAPLIVREIHYRLLVAEHGAMLRQLCRRTSHAGRIAAAINVIRADLSRPISVPELAGAAAMSPSSFHEHFRSVTATSPLRFQKDLRLLEARRLLTTGDRTVTEAAFEVGYRSPTHFSREYSRKFGVAPRDDRRRVPAAS